MGSQAADLEATIGVRSVVNDWVLNPDKSVNGKFVNIKAEGWDRYDGGEVPW